jgi:hypothetical protein
MLAYKDFYPKIEEKGGYFTPDKWQSLEAAMADANAWLTESKVSVLNVETVVLPNMWSDYEEGPQDAHLTALGTRVNWYQFIRVWYMQN